MDYGGTLNRHATLVEMGLEMIINLPSHWIVWLTAIEHWMVMVVPKVLAMLKVGSCARHAC